MINIMYYSFENSSECTKQKSANLPTNTKIKKDWEKN